MKKVKFKSFLIMISMLFCFRSLAFAASETFVCSIDKSNIVVVDDILEAKDENGLSMKLKLSEDSIVYIKQKATSSANRVSIKNSSAKIIFDSLKLSSPFPVEILNSSDVVLSLIGKNVIKSQSSSALRVSGSKLTINGSGSLEATGAYGNSGIGGSKNDSEKTLISIESGNVNAKVLSGAASEEFGGPGIGGRSWNEGQINISGGKILATGGKNSPAIGFCEFAHEGDFRSINVSGGEVEATSGSDAAAIGSGNKSSISSIKFSDCKITANSSGGGAAIGSGKMGVCEEIILDKNSKVIATSVRGAAVGSSEGSSFSTKIEINENANLTAKSNYGAAIGSGINSAASFIVCRGGNVDASSIEGAGIGGGQNVEGGVIELAGAKIIAKSKNGAGVGGGNGRSGGNISILSGDISSSSSSYGAGIGGGNTGSGGIIKISGDAKVNSVSGTYGAGIGGGKTGFAGEIIINGASKTHSTGSSNTAAIGDGFEPKVTTVNSSYIEISGNSEVFAKGSIGLGFSPFGPGGKILIDEDSKLIALSGNDWSSAIGLIYSSKLSKVDVPVSVVINGGNTLSRVTGIAPVLGSPNAVANFSIEINGGSFVPYSTSLDYRDKSPMSVAPKNRRGIEVYPLILPLFEKESDVYENFEIKIPVQNDDFNNEYRFKNLGYKKNNTDFSGTYDFFLKNSFLNYFEDNKISAVAFLSAFEEYVFQDANILDRLKSARELRATVVPLDNPTSIAKVLVAKDNFSFDNIIRVVSEVNVLVDQDNVYEKANNLDEDVEVIANFDDSLKLSDEKYFNLNSVDIDGKNISFHDLDLKSDKIIFKVYKNEFEKLNDGEHQIGLNFVWKNGFPTFESGYLKDGNVYGKVATGNFLVLNERSFSKEENNNNGGDSEVSETEMDSPAKVIVNPKGFGSFVNFDAWPYLDSFSDSTVRPDQLLSYDGVLEILTRVLRGSENSSEDQYLMTKDEIKERYLMFDDIQYEGSDKITKLEVVFTLFKFSRVEFDFVVDDSSFLLPNDISKNDKRYNAVVWAVKNKIVSLDSNQNFNPNSLISRGEITPIVNKFFGWKLPGGVTYNPRRFSDLSSSNSEYFNILMAAGEIKPLYYES